MELWTAARTDPELKAALRIEERRLRATIRAVADGIRGPEIAGAPLYAELCEILFTSMRGVAIAYAFEDRPATTTRTCRSGSGWPPGCSPSTPPEAELYRHKARSAPQSRPGRTRPDS